MKKYFKILKRIKMNELGISFVRCDLCSWPIQIKISDDEMGVRCLRCKASAVSQSLGFVFNSHIKLNQNFSIYELSSRGSFVHFLQQSKHQITLSEFYSSESLGQKLNGVYCEDVQQLTFDDNSFDVCTSLEVFEHVEDDIQGFKELLRVLKPGGLIIFTVPINLNVNTIERTKFENGIRTNVLSPEYHSDSLQGENKVFCFRNYGKDITTRLESVGFVDCRIIEPNPNKYFGLGRPVIIGMKPNN